jgi:hypothetical protein
MNDIINKDHDNTMDHNSNSNHNVMSLKKINVHATSLTSLLPQIIMAQPGSHLMIKFDIERAEYVLLNEAFTSHILCNIAENAVRIDILIEMHQVSKEQLHLFVDLVFMSHGVGGQNTLFLYRCVLKKQSYFLLSFFILRSVMDRHPSIYPSSYFCQKHVWQNVRLEQEEGYDYYKQQVHPKLKSCSVNICIGREGGY